MNTKLNPFEKGRYPENIEELKLVKDELVEKVVKSYFNLNMEKLFNDVKMQVSRCEVAALNDLQLNILIAKIKDSDLFCNPGTGLFLSKLIQNSYDAGNRELSLCLTHPIAYFGYELKCNKKLVLNIRGNLGKYLGNCAQNVIFNIDGDVSDVCGWDAEGCKFHINGNAAEQLGWLAEDCKFYVNNVGEKCGSDASGSEFYIRGDVSDYCGIKAKFCDFFIKGSVGERCGEKSVECLFDIVKDLGIWSGICATDSIYIVRGDVHNGFGDCSEGVKLKVKRKKVYDKMKKLLEDKEVELIYEPGA